ncbi:MAG: hypothetical protein KF746_25585 [Chitinophagaceae bacterium]|nr:hypothetical protein [Chitinophagaceae bacterium]
MKKKPAIVFLGIILLVLIAFGYTARQNNRLKATDDIPRSENIKGVRDKKNQFELPFLESLTRHLLALGY